MLANRLTNGNIKLLRKELILYVEESEDKKISDDILPPRFVRGFLNHLGYTEEEIVDFFIID